MNEYEEKQAARRERMQNRAERLAAEGSATLTRARDMASAIPFGQPILVDHYSARRDRSFRDRIHKTHRRGFDQLNAAEKLSAKAERVGTGGISSDDPDAAAKIQQTIDELEAAHEVMKAANRVIRKHDRAGSDVPISELVGAGMTEDAARNLLKPKYPGDRRRGFPSYSLSNNKQNIARYRKRLASLARAASRETVAEEHAGYTYREDAEQNRVMFVFPGKPDAEIRKLLKGHGFKWSPSRGAWVRMLNSAGQYAAEAVRAGLEAKRKE